MGLYRPNPIARWFIAVTASSETWSLSSFLASSNVNGSEAWLEAEALDVLSELEAGDDESAASQEESSAKKVKSKNGRLFIAVPPSTFNNMAKQKNTRCLREKLGKSSYRRLGLSRPNSQR